jgi:hypothetical protein
MKAKTPSHIKGSALQAGPLMGRRHDLPSLASFKENAPRLKALNKHWKLYHGEDGRFASGRLGQVWEYGVGKVGFTVTSGRMISKMIAAGYTPTQRGDGEANFSCAWTAENIHKLESLLRIRLRRVAAAIPRLFAARNLPSNEPPKVPVAGRQKTGQISP